MQTSAGGWNAKLIGPPRQLTRRLNEVGEGYLDILSYASLGDESVPVLTSLAGKNLDEIASTLRTGTARPGRTRVHGRRPPSSIQPGDGGSMTRTRFGRALYTFDDLARARWMASTTRVVLLGLLMVLSSGCTTGGNVPTSGPPDVSVAPADSSLVGRWVDASGRELPDGTDASGEVLVLQANVGSTICTTDNVTVFIRLAWPVGRELNWGSEDWTDADAPQFVRDTTGSSIKTFGPSNLDAELPRTAQETGFQHQGNRLSVDSGSVALYVTRPDNRIERWAQVRPGEGCA